MGHSLQLWAHALLLPPSVHLSIHLSAHCRHMAHSTGSAAPHLPPAFVTRGQMSPPASVSPLSRVGRAGLYTSKSITPKVPAELAAR